MVYWYLFSECLQLWQSEKLFSWIRPVNFLFLRYHGPQESTNMLIVDIKLLSGFTADYIICEFGCIK